MKRGLRAALRRRYAYAGLRVWRVAVRRALREHTRRMMDPTRSYSIDTDELTSAYYAGMRRLRKRFPNLDFLDPRSHTET